MAITIAAGVAALNQFQNRFSTQIHQSLKQGLEWETLLPFEPMDYAYTGQEMEGGQALQPWQVAFTPVGDESWDGITNILQIGKIDKRFDEDQLNKFFSRFHNEWFQAGNGNDPEMWDYARWVLQNNVIYQAMEDLNKSAWSGDYAAPTPGTAGAMLTSFTGWAASIVDLITAGEIVPLTTGALLTGSMVDQVRDFCAQVPVNYRYKPGKIFMSKTNAQKYSDNYKATYPHRDINTQVTTAHDLVLRVDDYGKMIYGMTSMEGSDRIMIVFDDPNLRSLIIGNRRGYNPYPIFRFEPEDRKLKCFSEVYRVFGFETVKHFFCNEQV